MWRFFFIILIVSCPAHSGNEAQGTLQDMLISAKFTGLCGALQQMTTFQESTKIDGGDQFLERFAMAESARLGMSTSEFFEMCEKSIEKYKLYTDMANDIGNE